MTKLFNNKNFIVFYTLVVVLVTFLLTTLGAVVLNRAGGAKENEVSRDIVIDRVQKQFFAVTHSFFLDEEVKIKVDRQSDWNEFLWGKEIVAKGRVRVDVGIDLQNITAEDVEVDSTNKKITIRNAEVKILDASVTNKLEVSTGGTILTQIFDRNTNEDYKMAVTELVESAKTATTQQQVNSEVVENAQDSLTKLFAESGYVVEIEE